MPPYVGFDWFVKPYILVMQWIGKQTTVIGHVIAADFAVSLLNLFTRQRIPFTEALLNIKNLVDYHLMAQ